jgi:anti-anti-sigma factor
MSLLIDLPDVQIDLPEVQSKSPFICETARFEVVCSDGCIALLLAGELDAVTTTRLRDCLHNAMDDGMGRIVLDVAAVTYMDSRALTVLMHARTRINELGGTFIIIGAAPPNVRLFKAAGLASYLSHDPDEHRRDVDVAETEWSL